MYGSVGQDEDGMRKLFRSFSFPGGIGSHVTPEVPGSINEGGELGYSLSHAYGAAFDNPSLHVFCVVGDGEAETGPLAASWHSNKFLNPARDGAVVPILHLNGYKIANPTILARIPDGELTALFEGYGYRPIVVAGSDPAAMHQALAATLDDVLDDIERIQRGARADGDAGRPSVADDHPAHAQGLDRPGRGRRQALRRHLARPPGADRRRAREPKAPGPARGLAAQLPARGALRRSRPADGRHHRSRHPRATGA